MDKYCQHHKLYNGGKNEYYFFTWSIPEVSVINDLNVQTGQFKMMNGFSYYVSLTCSKDKIALSIASTTDKLKCSVSMILGSKTILLSNVVDTTPVYYYNSWYFYRMLTLSPEDESFQKLKKDPNNTLAFICKIIYPGSVSAGSVKTSGNIPTDSLYNFRSLGAILRDSSESSLKEKVLLQVGEETLIVSKAVLCGRSPVFAKMFENDMREMKENEVTVTDIKMPVLRALVSFLYNGKVSNHDFDFLCDLYYATDKYDVADLCQICVDSLISQISMKNIHFTMKLAFSHNDEVLKSTVMALIATNIETWFSTNEWINLVNDEPKIAVEVLNFFGF